MSALIQCQTDCQVQYAAPHMCMLAAKMLPSTIWGGGQHHRRTDRAINPVQSGRLDTRSSLRASIILHPGKRK